MHMTTTVAKWMKKKHFSSSVNPGVKNGYSVKRQPKEEEAEKKNEIGAKSNLASETGKTFIAH